jgi:predicted nucleotidyltransferase
MKPKVSKILKGLRAELQSIYGRRLAIMILFGSQARGDAASGSDVDVLVILHGDVDPGKEIARTGKAITALSLDYDAVLSCVFMSSKRYASENTPLLLNVRNEGIRI